MIDEALIICGGLGTRLVNTGYNHPKSLIDINGEKLIDTQLKLLIQNGFRKVFLALGVGHEEIIKHISNSSLASQIEIVVQIEDVAMGTGGALLSFQSSIRNNVFILYGDILVNLYMDGIVNLGNDCFASIVTRRSNHPEDSDIVSIDHNRNLIDFHSKPHVEPLQFRNIAATGMFIFSPDAIQKLFEKFGNTKFDLERDGIKYLLEAGDKISSIPAVGLVQDLGTLERMTSANTIWGSKNRYLQKRPAIFIDRDGTINYEQGHLTNADQFQVYSDVPSSIALLKERGYFVFVITNQPVLARGETTWLQVEEIHMKLERILESESSTYIDEIMVCPHHPDSGFLKEDIQLKVLCLCRKPKIGLVKKCLDYYPIDLSMSWIVGDTWRDLNLAKNLGIKFAGVRSNEMRAQHPNIHFFDDLKSFVDYVERKF